MFIATSGLSSAALEIPEAFNRIPDGGAVPILALIAGFAWWAIIFFAVPTRDQKAWSFIAGVAMTLVALPVASATHGEHYEVSGMVVNSIPNQDGAVIALDGTGREMIQLDKGPLPYLGDSVDLSCTLVGDADKNGRVFHCDVIELWESDQMWSD